MSSGTVAFVDLTSSPCSSPRSAARRGPAGVSTVELADPSLDLVDVRASLSALQQAVDQTEALRGLRSNHEALRREFLASRRRVEDLDRQLADAANAASPYMLFCQHKYDVIRHKLESTRTELADCLNALQERLDNSRELEACRLRYRDLKLRYNEAVSEFHDRISTLEAQLAAASSFGVIIPPDTARRIADLESQLARSQSDLQVARERQSALASELRESATSHKAAQAEVTRLEAAIKRKNCRLRTLHANYERRLRVADTTIATHTAELGRLQDRVSTLDRDLQKTSQRAQAAISQRDQARAAHIATREYCLHTYFRRRTNLYLVSQTIVFPRLETLSPGWKSGLTKSRDLRSRVRISSLRSLRFSRRKMLWQFKEMRCSVSFASVSWRAPTYGLNGTRLSNIASLLPSAPSHKRARSESECPTQSTRVSKAARSSSRHAPASRPSIELVSAVAAGQKAEGLVLSPSSAGPPDHLPRSVRSTAKGGRGDVSSSLASEAGALRDGGESPSGESGSTHVFDSDATGSDSGSPESSRAKNEFGKPPGLLSDADLAAFFCRLQRFPDRSGFPVIAIVAAFAAMASSPGLRRIFVRPASWRWTRIHQADGVANSSP
ncbi:hypothetical protein F444_22638 [Phytophthora nicotianae P1976]|uniref:Uncharacterized protein n=1 Tax=Phytophthora nicotianae P1976 TaxID=1317066 RepID=A0A080YX73_PHYNI|nr:hypothetical protein F444_22638 [Phytophthora nicotianae P1976]